MKFNSEEEYAAWRAQRPWTGQPSAARQKAEAAKAEKVSSRAGRSRQQADKASAPKRDYKAEFLSQLEKVGIPAPEREVKFHDKRRWRLDFAYPAQMIAIEYNGIFGTHGAGHQSLNGIKRDYEKWTEASLLGWRLILIDAESVTSGLALQWLERALKQAVTSE